MQEITVCRICLLMDVKMFDLQSHPLNLYFGSVTGSNLLNIDNCPPLACFECATLVKKFYFFKQKCLKSQNLLSCLVDHKIKITTSKLKQIDRQGLGLCSNLTTQYIASGSVSNFLNKEVLINQEPIVENISSEQEPSVENTFIKEEPTLENSEPDLEIKACDIKEECDLLPDGYSLSDEFLSVQEEEQIKVDDHEDNNILNKISNNRDVPKEPEINKAVPNEVVPNKNSKRTPKKLINELLNDVTVTELTLQEQIEELKKRKESPNYLNSPIKCELCFKGFGDTYTWKSHLEKHSPKAGPEECPVCKLRFKTARCMGKHWKRHLTKYACKYCTHVSSDPSQAKNHLGQHKGVKYTCERCDLTFTVLTTYLSHVRIKHSSQYACDVCGGPFVSELGLYRHKVMVHKYDKGFGEFLRHTSAVKDDTQFEEIDASHASTSENQKHTKLSTKHISNDNLTSREISNGGEDMRTTQNVRPVKQSSKYKLKFPTKCEHCCKKIQNVVSYRLHYRRAHPEVKCRPPGNNYECDVCDKSFEHHTNLLYHSRVHAGEKLYKCPLCHKTFSRLCDLQEHDRSHRDERPYVCDYCRRRFKCKSAVKKHIAIHTSEKPFQCSICNKTFPTSTHLNDHVDNMHATKPETCSRQLRRNTKNKPRQFY